MTMLALLMSASICRAQDNFYSIDNECYAIMESMNFQDSEAEYMHKAQKMQDLAIKKKDKKAETIAYCQKMVYYDNINMLPQLHKHAELLRKKAKETGYMQYYYFAYTREIEHEKDHNIHESLRLAKQMLKDSNADNNLYGQFECYQALGSVYKTRQNPHLSKEYYMKALQIAPKLERKQRVSSIYLSIASMSKNYNEIMDICQHAMDAAIETSDSLRTLETLCIANGRFKKKKEFFECLSKAEKIISRTILIDRIDDVIYAYKAGFEGDYEAAYELLDKKQNELDRYNEYLAGEIISEWAGDGERALKYAMNRERDNSLRFINQRGYEFAELNDLMENERLQSQKAEQDRQQALLELDAKTLETNRQALIEKTKQLAMLDAQMERKNKQTEAANIQKQEELKTAEALQALHKEKELQEEQEYTRITLVMVIAALSIVAAIIIALLVYYRKTGKNMLNRAITLREARNAAQEASAMKNVFIQNMSHEIRTPLNAVMGFSQLMTIPGLPLSDEEKVEYAGHILNNAKMLTMLVDDILNTADIEQGNLSINYSDCKANEILSAAISTAEYRAQDGVRIYYTTEVDDDFTIFTDPRRVQQVLINFLTNACKHTDQGSIHLHLSMSENPGKLTFSVADTGCGIPKEQAENIFERFTKLNDFKQGTGLGLNICRLISKKMDGKVYCDTSYTDGAKFVFVLPFLNSENEVKE